MAVHIPVPTLSRTTNGSVEITLAQAKDLRATLDVTVDDFTTLDVVIEQFVQNIWIAIGTFAQLAVVGTESIAIAAPHLERCRVRWTIVGTAGTFEVRIQD